VPCSIKLLKTPKGEAGFHDFDEFEVSWRWLGPKCWPTWWYCSEARPGCDAAR
jgi:hypothetical protein